MISATPIPNGTFLPMRVSIHSARRVYLPIIIIFCSTTYLFSEIQRIGSKTLEFTNQRVRCLFTLKIPTTMYCWALMLKAIMHPQIMFCVEKTRPNHDHVELLNPIR
jgi:hypothetical protein